MGTISVKNVQEGQIFQLQVGGKRIKKEQTAENFKINGVKTECTKLVVSSILETLEIILPVSGFWKFENKDCLVFIPSEEKCAEFKIMLV